MRVDWPELAELRRQGSVVLYGLSAAQLAGDELGDDLDDIADLAQHLTGAGGAQVNLLDGDRQVTLADTAQPPSTIPREHSMCSTVLDRFGAQSLVLVPDLATEPVLRDHPQVNGDLGAIRFYAGVPLVGSDGLPLGMLCVWGEEPRALDELHQRLLVQLGRAAVHVLDLRRRRRARAATD